MFLFKFLMMVKWEVSTFEGNAIIFTTSGNTIIFKETAINTSNTGIYTSTDFKSSGKK